MESFDASVEHFISEAADDPQTISIKMTAYRIGDDTPFVKSLIRAAEQGKQVACVMEIKARFDEERNLHWAAELERVGAHVTFGIAGLKTHAKTALVVRKEAGGLKCYAHIGTGNYHVKTAKLYADFGLLTCDLRLTKGCGKPLPLSHRTFSHSRLHLVACGAVDHAPAAAQINRARSRASASRQAGAHRGQNEPARRSRHHQCVGCSIPGGRLDRSDHSRLLLPAARSAWVHRKHSHPLDHRAFLEHSRVFHFANGKKHPVDGEFFIGSADWMYGNLSKRIEVVTPDLCARPAGSGYGSSSISALRWKRQKPGSSTPKWCDTPS